MHDIHHVRSSWGNARTFRSFSLSEFWKNCSLTVQFTVVAAIVIGIIMAVLGGWVASRIESSVISNTASAAALYMDRFVEPHIQGLAKGDDLSAQSQEALAELMKTEPFREHVAQIKIWRADGTIVYSNNEKLVGKTMPISDSLAKALAGEVAGEFNHLGDEENVVERSLGMPLLEIYSPIRERNTTRVIAVAEFYQLAGGLARELAWARMQAIFIVGGLSLLMLAALMGIVRRGSRTIVDQQHSLNSRISDLSKSLAVNQQLRERVAEANRRATESNERFLRRVSAELHDGPVQLIGLVLLRLDSISVLAQDKDKDCASEALEIMRDALKEALGEIRCLSHGLALPEIENLSFAASLDLVISNHELRTGTSVDVDFPNELPAIPTSIKTCAYRFVQEGLNNAFRHAEGLGQQVKVNWNGGELEIEVSDNGPGISGSIQPSAKSGIGLAGMRDRIESLGGTMHVGPANGQGARITATFSMRDN